jgi:hypothetical protein
LDEPQCLGECGTFKQSRLSWDDHHLRGQQRRGREHADVRWSIDGCAIKVASDLRRVVIERVTREIDESAASRQPLLRMLGPVASRVLRVGVDHAGALTLASADTSKCSTKVVLSAPHF